METSEVGVGTNAIIKVNPYGDVAVLQLVSEGNRLRDYAAARVILTDVDVASATDDLSLLARLKRSLEDKRKEYTGPVNDHLKAINEAFKVVGAPFEEADRITRTKVLAYRAEQERKRRETEEINRLRLEAAQREAAMNQGEITEAVVVLETPAAPPAHVRTDSGTLGTSMVWKFEVTDFQALPDEYKMVDSVKLGKVVRAGLHNIAGVRIWEEETLRVTAK
jgi:hypothetical protein